MLYEDDTLNTFPNAKHRCQADIIAAAEHAINVHNMRAEDIYEENMRRFFYVKQ